MKAEVLLNFSTRRQNNKRLATDHHHVDSMSSSEDTTHNSLTDTYNSADGGVPDSHGRDGQSPSKILYADSRPLIPNEDTSSHDTVTVVPLTPVFPPVCLGTMNVQSSENASVSSVLLTSSPVTHESLPVALYTSNGLQQQNPEFHRPSIIMSVGSIGVNLSTSGLSDSVGSPVLTSSTGAGLDLGVDLQSTSQTEPVASPTYLKLFHSDKDPTTLDLCECRWMNCDKRFMTLDDLVNHVNDQHVKVERPDIDYQCKWEGCPRKGKGFNARYKMLIHIRTHTNEKPHKCNICGKCFSRLENLKIHNRSHTGEKPYICPFEGCNKAYSNSSDRFKHVRTHQEEKPYICKMPGCNKRYTDPSSLRKHVRTHGHYYRENERQLSKSKTPSIPSNPVSPSSSQTSHSPLASPPVSRLIPLSPGGVIPHNMSPHLLSVHNMMHVTNYTSNPLLSSTMLSPQSSAQSCTSTQTEGIMSPISPLKLNLSIDKSPVDSDDKCQDGPLDLTTNTSSDTDTDVNDRDSASFPSSKWELIH